MLVFPYRAGSKSAKALAAAIGGKQVKLKGSKLKGNSRKTVINWGSGELPAEVMKCSILNPPGAVKRAANKLNFFIDMKEAGHDFVPPFAASKAEAVKLLNSGPVVCRTVLSGHSGAGIIIATKKEELPDCSLYVKYIKKQQEYRIHVVKGKVVDIQRKARDRSVADDKVDWQIRNHQNGFVFVREGGIDLPTSVKNMAVNTIATMGLDFGAVDVIFNQHSGNYYVLEVNTAPGLEGQTVKSYAEAFKS